MREHPPDGPEAGTNPPEPPSSDAALMRKTKNEYRPALQLCGHHDGAPACQPASTVASVAV